MPAINSQRSGKLNSTEAEQIPDPYYQIAKTTFARSSRKLPSMNSARAHPIGTVCRFLGANTHVEFSQASRRQFTRVNPSDYKLGSESGIHKKWFIDRHLAHHQNYEHTRVNLKRRRTAECRRNAHIKYGQTGFSLLLSSRGTALLSQTFGS